MFCFKQDMYKSVGEQTKLIPISNLVKDHGAQGPDHDDHRHHHHHQPNHWQSNHLK